jgi:hypothetical protein
MEGYIATKVYGCKVGDSVFKRITPIASILAWAEICDNTRGQICLLQDKEEFQTSESKKEISLAFKIEENEGHSEISSLYPTFDSSVIELKSVETKLLEGLERIRELENQLAEREEDTNKLKEELEVKSKKTPLLKSISLILRKLQETLRQSSRVAKQSLRRSK